MNTEVKTTETKHTPTRCPSCGGLGVVPTFRAGNVRCETCNGTGLHQIQAGKSLPLPYSKVGNAVMCVLDYKSVPVVVVDGNRSNAEDQADFIVRACNEHAALVAVAEAAEYACCGSDCQHNRCRGIRAALANLAAARGQK